MVVMRNKNNTYIFISEMIDGTVKVQTDNGDFLWNVPKEQVIATYQYYDYKVVN